MNMLFVLCGGMTREDCLIGVEQTPNNNAIRYQHCRVNTLRSRLNLLETLTLTYI